MNYEKQREDIRSLLLKKIDYREIAKKIGCSVNTVIYQSNVSGIPISKKEKKQDVFLREYHALLKDSVPKAKISRILMKKFDMDFKLFCVYRFNAEKKIAASG